MKTRTCTNPSPARDGTERSRRSREAGAAPQPAAILGSAWTGSGAPSGARLPAAEAQLDRRRSVLSPAMKTVFVTVGTTSFDELIAAISSPAAEQVLRSRGCRQLVLQIGRGALQPAPQHGPAFVRDVFRFKESLAEDLRRADLVISHAGAGSCLETLEEGKPLLVVINEKLMDNHQLELARQLHKDGHVLYCNCSTLVETLQSMDLSTLKPFPPGQPEKFALFLDKVVGFE